MQAVAHIDFLINIVSVGFNRMRADAKFPGDIPIGQSGRYKVQDFPFPHGQRR